MSLSEQIVGHVTYPLHEFLRRRPTLREYRLLHRLTAGTPEHLHRAAARHLTELLTFAAENLPFYAARFAQYGVNPRGDEPYTELRKLPVLEKADVRANAAGMVWRGVPGGPRRHSSGGTTGDTLHFHIDRQRQAEDLSSRLFMQSLFGVPPGARRLYLWGSPIESNATRIRRWRDRFLNELLLNAFDMSPAQLDAHLARLVRFQPRVIYGYPSAMALLARHAARRFTARDFPWLRLVVLTGEEATADQMAQVQETLGCAVAREYGSREVGLIAHECSRGRMHVLSPHVHVDIAQHGEPIASGRCGDVICTTLNVRAQPFIRYRVGDLGRVQTDECPCGLPLPVMRLEGGKITGFIALPDGRLCHGAITSHVLRDQKGIVEFKTYQHALRDFEVLLVVDQHFEPATIDTIRQRYRFLFGSQVNVDCRVVERIPPDQSGKRRYVVSDVAPNYAQFRLASTSLSQVGHAGNGAQTARHRPSRCRSAPRRALSEWLVHHLTYPLHERLRGRATLEEMELLRRMAAWPAEAVQRDCAVRLRNLLQFAGQTLPYYAELFAQRGVAPDADDPYAELAKLPVLQKADVRAQAERMVYPYVPGGPQPAVSGGTTGDTLHFYIDRLRQAQTMGARLFMQQLFDVQPGDRRVYLWGSPIELQRSHVRHWRDRLLNEILLDAFDMSSARMDEYLQRIKAFQPRLVYAYTSAIALLARHAVGRYDPSDFPALRAIVATGDEIHPEHRAIARRTFGCQVVSEYGSREVGLIGHECPAGRLHVIAPHVHVDITQGDTCVPYGRCGNITCTTLNTRAQPMIRYRLGDVGALSDRGCDCGQPFPVLEITAARITGFVAMPDGRLRHGHLVAYLVRADPCITEFKVYQRTLDTFEVLLVVDKRFSSATIPALTARFRQYFGPAARIDCRVVTHIPPDPSGKRRHVVSDVAPNFTHGEIVAP